MRGRIEEVGINEIINYFENPRHDIGNDEMDTLEKLFSSVGTTNMLNLAEDLAKNGFLGCLQPTIVYSEEKKKYIVYEGNRRIACMKLLQSPDKFTFLDETSIRRAKNIIDGKNMSEFEKIYCYITDEEVALFIMERLHSGEDQGRGLKRWSPREREVFRVRQSHTKKLSYLVDYYIRKYFHEYDITKILPFTTIERIFNNRKVKKIIGINIDSESTFTKERMQIIIDTSRWIKNKCDDENIAPTRLFNKASDIENEVVPWLDTYIKGSNDENNKKRDAFKNNQQNSSVENNKLNNNDGTKSSKNITVVTVSNETTNVTKYESSKIVNQGNGGRNNLPYFFQGIKYGHLKPTDVDTHGVVRVCRELQIMSERKLVGNMPMSAIFLTRTIIEQSLIFYAKKHKVQGQDKYIWKEIEGIVKLSKIIDKYNRNLSNYITDSNMRDYFTKLFADYNETVNPMNWVVHRPTEYLPNTNDIIMLPQSGLLTIINFLIS